MGAAQTGFRASERGLFPGTHRFERGHLQKGPKSSAWPAFASIFWPVLTNKKGGSGRAAFSKSNGLQAVVHIELDRMRRHAETRDFFHLELDIGIKHVVTEDTALGHKCTVLVEVVQRLVK